MSSIKIKWIIEGSDELDFNDLRLLPDCVDIEEIRKAAQEYVNEYCYEYDSYLDPEPKIINIEII